jgi:hypothetical protein
MKQSYKPFIPAEVRRKKGESYRAAFIRVLNNFFFRFKGGYMRRLDKENSMLDSRPGYKGESAKGLSPRFLKQTYREFYAEIDAAVKELGIPYDKVHQVVDDMGKRNYDPQHDEAIYKAAWKTLMPIYRVLRRRGYNQSELWR